VGDRKRREREKERMKGEGDKGKAGRRKETEREKGTGRNFGHFVQAVTTDLSFLVISTHGLVQITMSGLQQQQQAAKLAAALSRVARVESTRALQKPSSSIIDEQ